MIYCLENIFIIVDLYYRYLFGIKISWCNQIVLAGPSIHTSSIKAGQFNQFGEKDVHSRRIGQSW